MWFLTRRKDTGRHDVNYGTVLRREENADEQLPSALEEFSFHFFYGSIRLALTLWHSLGSIRCRQIITIASFPYVHVDSVDETTHEFNEAVQYLSSLL